MTQIIRTENLSFSDGENSILENINLTINEGEHIVFTGPSGSGKTSILLTILGYNIPTEGHVYFRKSIVGGKSIALLRSEVSYISQEPVTGAPTFREALLLPFTFKKNRGKNPKEEEIAALLDLLKLDLSILDKSSAQLSGGEKQRLAIARELLMEKKIFILDEITSSLDPESKKAVMALLSRKEYTLLSISHDSDWIQMCRRNIEIRKGKIHSDTGSRDI